jgi:hypothetical protein
VAVSLSSADELLVHQLPRPVAAVDDEAASWFDRFYFCLHADGGPILVAGAGVYPNAGRIDGYACLARGAEQRNLRFSDALGGDRTRTDVGPLRWEVSEPLRSWRLAIGENAAGIELDATWTARSAPWLVEPIAVAHAEGPQTEFAHFFQCGRWEGSLTVDGEEIDVGGWLGARDRSWGVRRTRERLGMHLWLLAHFDDHSVAVHYNEHRDGRPQHCDGALLPDDGEPVAVTALRHDMRVDTEGELQAGRFELDLATGETVEVACSTSHPGLYMAGAGYGGWHGRDHGARHVEHERWALDGPLGPRTLSLGLTDKACRFVSGGRRGAGLVELALSRSADYAYRPNLAGRTA